MIFFFFHLVPGLPELPQFPKGEEVFPFLPLCNIPALPVFLAVLGKRLGFSSPVSVPPTLRLSLPLRALDNPRWALGGAVAPQKLSPGREGVLGGEGVRSRDRSAGAR